MSRISIQHQHSLDHEEALELAEKLGSRIAEKYYLNKEWDGDRLNFSGPGSKGYIDVLEDEIDLNIKLGLMWLPMQGYIESEIQRHLDEYFG